MKTTGLIFLTIICMTPTAFSTVPGIQLKSKRDLEVRKIEITHNEVSHDGTKYGRMETVFQVKWTPHEEYMKVVDTSITVILHEKKESYAVPLHDRAPVMKTVFPVTKDGSAIATFTFQDQTSYVIILEFGNRTFFFDYIVFSEYLNEFKRASEESR